MNGRRPAQPSLRGLFNRVANTIRGTQRTLEGADLTLGAVRDESNKIGACLVQLERVLDPSANDLSQSLLRELRRYRSMLYQEEIKLVQNGGSRTQYQPDRIQTGMRGGQKLNITREQMEFLLSITCSAVMIAQMLNVSVITIKRRIREFGLGRRDRYSRINNDELDLIVHGITANNANLGYRAVLAQLRSRAIIIQEHRIRQSMQRVNPSAVAMRWGNAVQRRTYKVTTPNALWHIDGNHKLIRWKFVIHGGIDGYSRLVVYLKVATNNYARTVMAAFREATMSYGVPSRVRMDQGIENGDVDRFMVETNGPNRGSAIRGRSVHNQRIERLWVDVFQGVSCTFHHTFSLMEEMGILNVDDNSQLFALHHTYVQKIQQKLDNFRMQYNSHNLRTEHGRTPHQLFTMGTLQNFHSSHAGITGQLAVQQAEDTVDENSYDVEESDDPPPAEENHEAVIVPPVNCPLSPRSYQLLKDQVMPSDNDPLGIDYYRKVLTFLAEHV